MKNFIRKMATAAAAGLVFASSMAIAVTYTRTLLADGTNLWAMVSTDTSAVSPVQLKNNSTVVATFDGVNGLMVLSGVVGGLPTCTTAINGAVRFVTDNNGTTVGGTAVGSSTTKTLVVCAGAAGTWVVG